jgi:hypothetical protein
MLRALALMVLLVPLSALADRYDDVVGAAFPGFHIMSPSEIDLVKDEMTPELYAEVKDRPGLTVGDFNGDGRPDFAALIRHPAKKRDQRSEYYDGYLVACYGLDGGKFDCVPMTPEPRQVHVPFGWFLATVPPGRQTCHGQRTHDTQDPRARGERSDDDTAFITKHDAIGYFRTMGNGDIMYAYRSRTRYTLCILSD